jgi:hypothetical protein
MFSDPERVDASFEHSADFDANIQCSSAHSKAIIFIASERLTSWSELALIQMHLTLSNLRTEKRSHC